MDWGITLLIGLLLGFIFALLREYSPKPKEPRVPFGHITRQPNIQNTENINPSIVPIQFPSNQTYGLNNRIIEHRFGRLVNWETRYGLRPQIFPRSVSRQENTKILRENWKNSIVGLIKLADKNLAFARAYLDTGNCAASIQAAATSVENISRALICSYGEKPNPESGQEEALRMLSRRFQGNEKDEFEKAIDIAVTIDRNRTAIDYSAKQSMHYQIINRAIAEETRESATKIVRLFKQIISEKFAAEIPELDEVCPKCRSLDLYVSGFSEDRVNYTCKTCQSKWTEPR